VLPPSLEVEGYEVKPECFAWHLKQVVCNLTSKINE
jgi:hypothetical protein